MKSWLRNEGVYRTIMNGTLWTAFLAALASGKWPQFGWVAGCVTALMVLIAATVYCIAPRDDDRTASTPDETAAENTNELMGSKGDQRSIR